MKCVEASVTEPWTSFGPELRRLRTAADMSLTQLAQALYYSKGYISKIETGLKRPSPELAARCDTLLNAAGTLAARVPTQPSGRQAPEAITGQTTHDSEVWTMSLAPDGTIWFRLVDRRQALAAGAASVLDLKLSSHGMSAAARHAASLETFRALFDQFRHLGNTVSPAIVLPGLIAQTHTVQRFAARSDARTRGSALNLAARYAEYVGWMCQEAGNDEAALWWTDRAVELAAAGDDHDLASYALARQALIALYRNDADETIALSRQAQAGSVPPRIRGLAALHEAEGHALAHDYDACLRSLDSARGLLAVAQLNPTEPVLGSANLVDPVAMIMGWCLYDLGRPGEAAEVLGREVARLPVHALRSRVRYGIRGALAHATAGDIDHACEIADPLLGAAGVVDSATIRADIRRLARTLSRFRTNRSVRALSPQLAASLHVPTV
jgi:transcriptional regulator with XRE-family HTH domain